MDCNLDLEKVAEATVMKDGVSAAAAIGSAVLECAEIASHLFKGSLGLDITDFVLANVAMARKAEPSDIEVVRRKAAAVAGVAPKRRGRPRKSREG